MLQAWYPCGRSYHWWTDKERGCRTTRNSLCMPTCVATVIVIPEQTKKEAARPRVIHYVYEWTESYNYLHRNFTSFQNYCKRKLFTVHQNYDNSDVRFTGEQQKVLHFCTEQFSILQTKIINYPNRTFIIEKAGVRHRSYHNFGFNRYCCNFCRVQDNLLLSKSNEVF